MRCQVCGRPMTALFISYVCDYCDGLMDAEIYHHGYVVWRDRPTPTQEYVFRTRDDAERYRRAAGLHGAKIREVLCEHPFHWQASRGTIRDVILADRVYEVYSDHRFEPSPRRAFLADGAPGARETAPAFR